MQQIEAVLLFGVQANDGNHALIIQTRYAVHWVIPLRLDSKENLKRGLRVVENNEVFVVIFKSVW